MRNPALRSSLRVAPLVLAMAACSSTIVPAPDATPDAPVSDAPLDVSASDVPTTADAPDVFRDAVVDASASDVFLDVAVDTSPPPDAPRDVTVDAPDTTLPDVPLPDVPLPDVPLPDVPLPDVPPSDAPPTCARYAGVDLLFEIDNSNSMAENQANLAAQFNSLLDEVLRADPMTVPVRDLHVGVVSSDLGTPGSVVPSCANSDTGDDGLLNPVRNGLSIRTHQPWTTAPAGRRPARCRNDPSQYPSFLTYDTATTDGAAFREDFVCNAYLSIGGCGLEQQLEAVHRALVVRNPRATPGNTDPNAGFVRDDAVLGIFFITDEEDGSTRDCRFAEPGVPCSDAVSVFDIMSPDWSSSDLNLRFYMYVPGSRQDPTWPIDRYIDPARPNRGYTSLKPGRPDLVVVGALAGVPLAPPTRPDRTLDWDALLGRNPDGSDGYVGMSAEGPVSMRQRNMDPVCSTRVVPACRREGTSMATTCDPAAQYFALPSRRVAQVVRRFDERYSNGVFGSICATSYRGTLSAFATRIRRHLCRS